MLPGELLQELGIHSEPAELAATGLVLLGLLWSGFAALSKLLAWSQRRLGLRNPEEKKRLRRRQQFAALVKDRVCDLNLREHWSDGRFAELEAEVETVGNDRRRGLGKPFGRRRGLRRERSLSKALAKSGERLILLRGDPGSGKSVALRFVTQKMAQKAMKAKRTDAVIPLYVNLKDLRTEARKVDARLIEDFVLESLRRGGDREVHKFLDDEFSRSKEDGGWFFLFDSFDEIPEVLSSTEDDDIVRAYSTAISSFVAGMHTCRGVIASRHFRAPLKAGLPTFRIVPLSEKRKLELIDKAGIGGAKVQLEAHLRDLPPELATLSANPLFLSLLAEFVRAKKTLPEGWHDVFEVFVLRRLETDRERLAQHFHISSETLRRLSEEVAFTMTAADNFGLSPTREDLKAAYVQEGFSSVAALDAALDALSWIKLARSDDEAPEPGEGTFTFAHRRFQEYFATCVVLRESNRVSARTLLTDASWRETVVTLCHAQPDHIGALVAEADALLAEAEPTGDDARFSWRPGTLHLLGLLQSAFAGRTEGLTAGLQRRVATILDDARERGTITDRKWALEVVGTAPVEDMTSLLLDAFHGPSEWLREVAYRQVARLA
ncbi:MAG TPA: NACHT domain-containing protein, partial [Solirubrobacterales bacterium]|nr:NACHT domain-containing protein [Solirubrobacterales bacterium]